MYEFLKWAAALGLAIGLLACEPATRSIPAEPGSAAEFVELHPDRAASLLAAIDLERPDMAPVRQAFEAGDSAGALEALLEHYRSVDNGAWLQAEPYTHDPGGYEENIAEQASQVLGDVFTFQGVTGPVARLSNGAIDWFDSRAQGRLPVDAVPQSQFHADTPDQGLCIELRSGHSRTRG